MLEPSRQLAPGQNSIEDVYVGGQHLRAMDADLVRRVYDNLGKREGIVASSKNIEDTPYEIIGPIDYPDMEQHG